MGNCCNLQFSTKKITKENNEKLKNLKTAIVKGDTAMIHTILDDSFTDAYNYQDDDAGTIYHYIVANVLLYSKATLVEICRIICLYHDKLGYSTTLSKGKKFLHIEKKDKAYRANYTDYSKQGSNRVTYFENFYNPGHYRRQYVYVEKHVYVHT